MNFGLKNFLITDGFLQKESKDYTYLNFFFTDKLIIRFDKFNIIQYHYL